MKIPAQQNGLKVKSKLLVIEKCKQVDKKRDVTHRPSATFFNINTLAKSLAFELHLKLRI